MLEINLESVSLWAESDELDSEFTSLKEEDPDWFEDQILSLCDDWTLLSFAKNRNSSKRIYFANQLALRLSWVYKQELSLPFHVSRLQGIISLEEYKDNLNKVADSIYSKSMVLEEMRKSDKIEIKNLCNKILDYRSDRVSNSSDSYCELVLDLGSEIRESFRENVTLFKYCKCTQCSEVFRLWYDGENGEVDCQVMCSKCNALRKEG